MSAHSHQCSREDSRQARKIIAKSVYPFLGKDPALTISPECPLHPTLDMFKDQEAHKLVVPGQRDVFQCGYCQKQFKTEFYMDRHMDNKHPDRLNLPREEVDADADGGADGGADVPSSGHCLGDLCPVLGCGQYDTGSCRVQIAGGAGNVRRGCGMCDPSDMERRRGQCLALFDRCAIASDGSAAAHGGGAGFGAGYFEDLRDHFVRQFCDHLACDAHHRPLAPPLEGEGTFHRHPLPRGGGGMGVTKAFLTTVLVVGLIVFYVSMALGRRSRWTQKDLRPAKRERFGGRGDGGGLGMGVASSIRGSSGQLRRRVNRPLD